MSDEDILALLRAERKRIIALDDMLDEICPVCSEAVLQQKKRFKRLKNAHCNNSNNMTACPSEIQRRCMRFVKAKNKFQELLWTLMEEINQELFS